MVFGDNIKLKSLAPPGGVSRGPARLRRGWALLLALLCLSAAPLRAEIFQVKDTDPLQVTWGGQPLIVGQSGKPALAEPVRVATVPVDGWDQVVHLWRSGPQSRCRVELAASADAFELTMVRLVEAQVAGFVSYELNLPLSFLDGCQAEIIGTGVKVPAEAVRGNKLVGVLGLGGISRVNPIRYLRLRHPDRPQEALDFDFRPRGHWAGEKTITPHAAEWHLRRDRGGYVLRSAFSRTIHGTLQELKLVIRRADQRPVEQVHPRVANRWTTPHANRLRVNVGNVPVKGYQTAALPGLPAGIGKSPVCWQQPDRLLLQRDERYRDVAPVRLEGVAPRDPTEPVELSIDIDRPGHYLVNLLVGAPDRPVGPCVITSAKDRHIKMPAVAAGACDCWSVVVPASADMLRLRLAGDFRLMAFGVAPLLYENEDFLFRRPWWLSTHRFPEDQLPD